MLKTEMPDTDKNEEFENFSKLPLSGKIIILMKNLEKLIILLKLFHILLIKKKC